MAARREGGDPTEEPTPQRREAARRSGQVAVSHDLSTALSLSAAFTALAVMGPALVADLVNYLRDALPAATGGGAPGPALQVAMTHTWRALAAPVGAALVVGLGVGLIQTRGLLVFEPLRPDLGRLMSASTLRRLFGGEAPLEMAKGLAKVVLVGAVAWVTVRPLAPSMTALVGAPPGRALAGFGEIAGRLGLRVVLVVLLLGIVDYLLVRSRHSRQLRMTREEVRREHKESEGDPQHRAERQRLRRDLLEQRMIADVRKADFVVMNPEHIAVALRYDGQTQAAPVVVAKGERLLAEQIKQVAREAGVPIFRDVSLARALRDVREGDEIPEALYQAVAEILRTVRALGPGAPGDSQNDAPVGASPAAGRPAAAGFTWKRV